MSAKANQLAAQLVDELKIRFPGFIVTPSSDTNGDPTILLAADATPATTEKNVFIRVKAQPWPLAKDVLGLTAGRFTPHVIEFAVESHSAGVVSNGYLTQADWLTLLGTLTQRGTKVDGYASANGVVPVVATLNDSTKFIGSFQANYEYGMLTSS